MSTSRQLREREQDEELNRRGRKTNRSADTRNTNQSTASLELLSNIPKLLESGQAGLSHLSDFLSSARKGRGPYKVRLILNGEVVAEKSVDEL